MFAGYPGADTQNFGYDRSGKTIPLHLQSITTDWDIDHSSDAFAAAYDGGKLDGWNGEYACCGQPENFAYAYAPHSEVRTYWQMAARYVLADHVFQSNLDGSFVAHQYAIAAYAGREVDYPLGAWGCEGSGNTIATFNPDRTFGPRVPVCENYTTLGDELDAAGLSWRYYTYPPLDDGGLWSAYAAIGHIYNGPDWTADVITPATRFAGDVAAGRLAAVTWITPVCERSDHSGCKSRDGQAWVASLVNAVGESPFWSTTAIFVIWDDWGGWFDGVAPVYKDYDGLGFRVPLLVISPYAKSGYVSHVQYESSSVLRFMEDTYGLAPLAASDARAVDPAGDAFDFTQPPRPYTPFAAVFHPRGGPAVRPPRVGGD